MVRASSRSLVAALPAVDAPELPGWAVAAAVLAALALLTVVYRLVERRRKRRLLARFRRFSAARPTPAAELRGGERLAVPAALKATVTLTDSDWFGLSGQILDVSAGGFGIKPDFPLKKVPLDVVLNNVLVATPLGSFVVRQARTVRIEHQVQKRLLGLQLLLVDDDQRPELQRFLDHLHAFLRHGRAASAG